MNTTESLTIHSKADEGQSNPILNEDQKFEVDDSECQPSDKEKEEVPGASNKKQSSSSDGLIFFMGLALFGCGIYACWHQVKNCPNYSMDMLQCGYLFVINGCVAAICGGIAWIIESKLNSKKANVVLSLMMCPILFISNFVGLSWSSTGLYQLKNNLEAYEIQLPLLFEAAKTDYMNFWLNNYDEKDLKNRMCWLNIEKAGDCCGLNGPADWLNISGSMSEPCQCVRDSKHKYASQCELMKIPAWQNDTYMIKQNPCKMVFISNIKSKLVALIASSAVAFPIFFIPFVYNTNKRVKKCSK